MVLRYWQGAAALIVLAASAGADPLADSEAQVWQAVTARGAAPDYAFYLKFYPYAPHASEATAKADTAPSAAALAQPLPAVPEGFADSANWIGDGAGQCWAHDRDKERYDAVALTWTGKCQAHKLEGPGIAVALTARGRIAKIVIGSFAKGQLNGPAMVFFSNGDRREGSFADGRLNGEGGFYYSDGGKQVGTFKDNRLNGRGIDEVEGLWRTEGTFDNNFLEGHAVTTYTNGDRIEGDFLAGLRNGFVKSELAGGSRIEATYKKGRLDGHFVQTMKDGSRFEADYADGYMMTDATYTRPNGQKYVGHYVPPRPDREHAKPVEDLYPRFAAFIGEEGKLRLRVTVNEDGSFSDVVVSKSSGFHSLDGAALAVVKQRLAYFPATVDGHPITMSAWPIFVVFKITK